MHFRCNSIDQRKHEKGGSNFYLLRKSASYFKNEILMSWHFTIYYSNIFYAFNTRFKNLHIHCMLLGKIRYLTLILNDRDGNNKVSPFYDMVDVIQNLAIVGMNE